MSVPRVIESYPQQPSSSNEPALTTHVVATKHHWNPDSPAGGVKIGWELRKAGRRVDSYAFVINPQAITRTPMSRATLYATRAAFYVDDFGPGSGLIQINQLVGGGRPSGGSLQDQVQNFYNRIYLRAVGKRTDDLEVLFYDNHFFDKAISANHIPERVWFPPNSFTVQRAVNLQTVWQLSITMMELDAPKGTHVHSAHAAHRSGTVWVVARANETLAQFARRHAGKKPSDKRVKTVGNAILHLNPALKRKRTVPVYTPGHFSHADGKPKQVAAFHVVAGEKVLVPS